MTKHRLLVFAPVFSALVAVAALARAAAAQEFIRQSHFIAPLRSAGAAHADRTARQVAEVARDRTERLINPKEVDPLAIYSYEKFLVESGYNRDVVLTDGEVRLIARQMRLDEIVVGLVTVDRGTLTVVARLAILRNWGMQQPLPVIHATTAAQAGEALAREVVAARTQFTGLRRCENARGLGREERSPLSWITAQRAGPAGPDNLKKHGGWFHDHRGSKRDQDS